MRFNGSFAVTQLLSIIDLTNGLTILHHLDVPERRLNGRKRVIGSAHLKDVSQNGKEVVQAPVSGTSKEGHCHRLEVRWSAFLVNSEQKVKGGIRHGKG